MLPVLGQTLLDRALDKVAATGPQRIVVALHHRADVVADHLRSGPHPVSVKVEERLTGPTRAVWSYGVDPDLKVLLVVPVTCCSTTIYRGLVDHHLVTAAEMTFATRRVNRASRFGVLEVDADGRVTRATEKPRCPTTRSTWSAPACTA